MQTALVNGTIFSGFEIVKGKVLLLEDGNVKGLIDKRDIPADAFQLDCEDKVIAPGLIDLQIYGGGGVLFSDDPSISSMKKMTDALVESGTTSFLITLATNSLDIFRKAIEIVKNNPNPAVLGLHFEGPYLNPIRSGAHLKEYIRTPTLPEITALVEEAEGTLKMLTLAPELCPPEVIEYLTAQNIVISAGHSNATYKEAIDGFKRGVSTTTHLFNAMSPLHHRNVGLPGAVFNCPSATASIIPDGVHVDFEALKISKKVLGDRLFLITDAVEESSGPYVHVKRADRFTLPDGSLSGSRIAQLDGVRNCVEHASISLEEALRMASLYPARVIGSDELGRILPGAPADFIVINKSLQLEKVIKSGKVIKDTTERSIHASDISL